MSEGEREGNNMDKKSARQASVPQKGNTGELRKDYSSRHRFPQQNKNKDVGSRHQNATPHQRPKPQKEGTLDKRPRSRGLPHGDYSDELTKVGWTEPEYGSVQSWGPKKNNLSHLLNFHFEPRDVYGRGYGRGDAAHGSHNRGKNKKYKGQATKYNKEHFLQANCQFIVKASGDYSVHSVDSDTLVSWDLIEQVRTYSHAVPSCPICLYPPVAAKITRCGHVYCAACILHYLSLGEKHWRKCPICYDAVLQKDLKSVVSLETKTHAVGEEVTLKLMKRRRGTTLALPVDQWSENDGCPYNIEGDLDTRYMKLLTATPAQVHEMMRQERQVLEVQLSEEGIESLEGSFVQAAIDLIKEREAGSIAETPPELVEVVGKLTLEDELNVAPTLLLKSPDKKVIVYSSAFSDEEDCVDAVVDSPQLSPSPQVSFNALAGAPDQVPVTASSEEPVEVLADHMSSDSVMDELLISEEDDSVHAIDEDISGRAQSQVPEFYYFFQSDDGQHIYIHSVNARCLIKEYGSLENCPPVITATILELEAFTMNEDIRRRIRYLSHLPMTCEFQVAELDLKPPLISKNTLRSFSREIDRKRHLRLKKDREERRFSQRIQNEEARREYIEAGIDRFALIVPSGAPMYVQTPAMSNSSDNSTPASSPPGSAILATSPASNASSEDGNQSASLSFAQMLRAGKAKPQEAWSKSSVPTSSGNVKIAGPVTGSDSDNEDRQPVPVYQASFGSAIQQALDKYKKPGNISNPASPGPCSGKKKKKQKTLLFTTSMNRAK